MGISPNARGVSPNPMGIEPGTLRVSSNMCQPVSPRNIRAQSVALHRSAIITSRTSENIKNYPKMQKSSSEISMKQLQSRQIHQKSASSDADNSEFWLRVVPSCKIKPRNCDEVPEEFKRAGIGLCFGGKPSILLPISTFISVSRGSEQ